MKIKNAKIEEYKILLQEKYRPPSKGGNTGALHSHMIIINKIRYSFLAFGSQQWIFKKDTVSFEYKINDVYNNIIANTIQTINEKGESIIRGNRGEKKMRTADARMPVSRREMKS
jgi:hypothetical protein